jgi:protein SCO1/2
LLEEDGVMVRPVFVTIDPARDTPEVLADFVSIMHPRMVGLTGDESAVAAAAKAYRVYAKKAGDDPQDYLMDHSTFIYLMAPEDGLLEIFRRDQPAEQIAPKTACFVDKL